MKAIQTALSRTLMTLVVLWLAGCATRPAVESDASSAASAKATTTQQAEAPRTRLPSNTLAPVPERQSSSSSSEGAQARVKPEVGQASWYAKKFHGRRTASGEMYVMQGHTAAHRTLPMPSYAQIKNVENGKTAIVRINDRGPFHADRVIDVSSAIAKQLGMVSAGVADVEVTPLALSDLGADVSALRKPDPATKWPKAATRKAYTKFQRGFYVQLAAFRDRSSLERLHQQAADEWADWMPLLAAFHEASVYKLKVGPFATRTEALKVADEAREVLRIRPSLVERR